MILLIGGTSDSREIARKLKEAGAGILVSTATDYGYKLACDDGLQVIQGCLDRQGIINVINSHQVKLLLDASHPYAGLVTKNAYEACLETGIEYLRYTRPSSPIPSEPLVFPVDSYQQAAEKACVLGENIFLAAGSRNVKIFIDEALPKGKSLIVRAIPEPEVIKGLLKAGIRPKNIVAMQGPFSKDLNTALFQYYQVDVLVTKESGKEGGFDEKLSAASKLRLPIVVIKRLPEPDGALSNIEEIVKKALFFNNK